MYSRRHTITRWISLFAGAIIILQIAAILTRGESFCLNDGCRLVEQLTTVPPLYLNLAGLLYFTSLFFASRRPGKDRPPAGYDLTRLLLLLGLVVEGVLLSYQVFVIHTLCSYCLIILSLILLLNLLYGWHQIRLGIPLFGAVLVFSAILNFSPASLLALRSESISAGTYAVKKCAAPAKKLYFFFSADCPHCKNVLTVLENCNSCEFNFNPVEENQTLSIAGLEYNPSYNPSLNRIVLSLLNITTIPVLLVQNSDGLTFIKGQESIISFVRRACFESLQENAPDSPSGNGQDGMNTYDAQEGECAIELECPDLPESTQSPYTP